MNRKQRRAKQSNATTSDLTSADDIPLARPGNEAKNTEYSKSKTLLQIAAEKQALLTPSSQASTLPPSITEVKIRPDGTLESADDGKQIKNDLELDAESTPWLDAIFLAVSLTAIHFTLDVLTVHQYSQQLRFPPIVFRTLVRVLPTQLLLIAGFNGLLIPERLTARVLKNNKVRRIVTALRQLVCLGVANVAGCQLIRLTHEAGYYAVIKNAPAIGTFWVWAILELGLVGAVAGVMGPGIYAWYYGYSIY